MQAAGRADIAAGLEANRRFHFTILETPDQHHAMRLIRLLWDSTEAYRAIYYNSLAERERSIDAHERIIRAIERQDAADLVAELDAHRERALHVLRRILTIHPEGAPSHD